MHRYKTHLHETEMPTRWYNVVADLPFALPPPLHPGTRQPLDPKELEAIFPKSLIEQEGSRERWIDIPQEVRDVLRLWRPTPLRRAHRLEHVLKTSSRIYYKDESVSPTGSHKTNTAVAQAFYNKQAGIKRLTTETGAGQWGCALSFSCNVFGLACRVYMVKVTYNQKPMRQSLMHLWGGEVIASPSDRTEAGRKILQADPHCPGSLGIAISEAVEDAAGDPQANYSLGSVLNHVLLHQTVIGLEAKEQLSQLGETPDAVIACVGGGSNFGGIAFPFVPDKLTKHKAMRIIAVEPTSCPSLTRGSYAYDFGDTVGLTPLLKMFTLGHTFIPPSIHAGGLRYHGASPIVSALVDQKIVEPMAYEQTTVFEAAVAFARAEGIVPAPETSHAVKAAMDLATLPDPPKVILFNLSGHGFLDLASYDKYLAGELKDFADPAHGIQKALKELP